MSGPEKIIPIHNLIQKPIQISTLENGDAENFMGIHRHDFFEIIWFTKSLAESYLELDFVTYKIENNHIFFIAPGQIIHKTLNQERGFLIAVTKEIFKECCTYYSAVLNAISPFTIPRRESATCTAIADLFIKEHSTKDREELLKTYLKAFCLLLEEWVEFHEPSTIDMHRLQQLMSLIEQNYLVEKDTQFYASQLNISSHHLNDIVRKNRATTVKKLVTERLILEAKRELCYGLLSIKEIAFKLGFDNFAYFSRFFKKQTGFSPEQFKNQI